MRAPRRSTAALASALWVAGIVGAFRGAFALLSRIEDLQQPFRLDFRQFLLLVLWAAIAWAGLSAGTWAFPFWRASLGLADRRRLVFAGMIGGVLGCVLGMVPAFLVLPPDLTAPVHSPRAMAVLFGCGFLVSVAAAYRETGTLALFAPPAPPAPIDVPLASDRAA
jgi:hypothetical protein